MTTTPDDGTTPVDPGDGFPVRPAYGSRALGDQDFPDTAPVAGLPLVPLPIDPVDVASVDPGPPEPADAIAPPPPVTPEAVAPQAPADEHETVVLAGAAAGASYVSEDVLPAGHVGRAPRASRTDKEPAAEPTDGEPGGRRLRRSGPTPLGRVVLPLILALVSGVAIVAGWIHLQDDRAASTSAPGTSLSPSPSASPAASGSPSPSPSVSVSPSVSASTVASTPPAVVASSPAASPSGSPSASAAPKVDRSVPVVVLNSTNRTGLAAKVAKQLRAEGWTVVLVGNFRGLLAITTVYAEGHADAVATMQSDLPTRDRQKPPFGAMNPKRLTVVIGADYPRT
jgi:hypothetical protein